MNVYSPNLCWSITDDVDRALIVTDEIARTSSRFQPVEFEESLRNKASYVLKLTIRDLTLRTFADLRLVFPNLSIFRCLRTNLKESQLTLLAKNCPDLQELVLYFCEIKVPWMDALSPLRNTLKRFIVDDDVTSVMSYGQFREILTNFRLECFKMNVEIVPDERMRNEKSESMNQLQELSVTIDATKWSENLQIISNLFENLRILSLRFTNFITADLLTTMFVDPCRHLTKLFICDTTFRDIRTFSLPSTIQELTLCNCVGLTYENLRQVLTLHQIRKFCSTRTRYEGVFEDFAMSSSVEALTLDDVHTSQFTSAYTNNENLHELTWYGENVENELPLESCINLQRLDIKCGFIPVATLHPLRHLQHLRISKITSYLQWSYIRHLLRHPPLQELCISEECNLPEKHSDLEGFPINLTHLEIHLEVFKKAISFWMDLFSQNDDLNLICCNFEFCAQFLKELIKCLHSDQYTIEIGGLFISCLDLKNNFDETWSDILLQTHNANRLERNEDFYKICFYKKTTDGQ